MTLAPRGRRIHHAGEQGQTRRDGWRGWRLWLAMFVLALGSTLAHAADSDPTSVSLAWNPSPDTNVVGYRLYYGAVSGQYTNSVLVGSTSATTITGLVNGTTYYFAITAHDAGGLESAFSNEVSYTVSFSRLQIAANTGAQMVLNIEGVTGQSYTIEATQDLKTWAAIGSVTPGANGSANFVDPNAANFAQRFYRVRTPAL